MGGCGIAYEYNFSKIASDLMGNSVQQWAIIIGLMMFFMGIGADVQKYISDKNIFNKFITIEIIQGLVGGFGPIVLLYFFGAFRDYYILIQYSFIIIVGLIIGLEIPLLMRINERYTKKLRVNIGGILRMDYIGAFVGAVFWLFILLRFFSLTQIGFVLGALNVLVSGLSIIYFKKLTNKKALLTVFVTISFLILAVGFTRAPQWTSFIEQRLFQDKVILSHTTRYQHIVLTQSTSKDIYCYINGNLQFSSYDEYIYHEFLTHPVMSIAPVKKKVLVLGGGDGLAVREVLKYPEVESITLVDLDPMMTDLAKDNPYLKKLNHNSLNNRKISVVKDNTIKALDQEDIYTEDRTKYRWDSETKYLATVYTINMDAVKFIEQISGVYDVIILDFPDPRSLELSKLYSKSFYSKLLTKLSKNGMLIQQSTSPAGTTEAFLSIGRTMKAAGLGVIPIHHHVPSFGDWGWWLGGRGDVYSAEILKEKLNNLNEITVPVKYITPQLIFGSLFFGKNILQTRETEINTIFNNQTYRYYSEALRMVY